MTRRWREHRRRIANGTHHNEIISRAWKKHGEDAFEFKPLFVCRTEDLLFYEQRAIDALKPEYNICAVAGSMLGVKRKPFSAEHRAALSLARKLRPKETRTEEQRKRISEGIKKSFAEGNRKPNPPFSEERKRKIAEALTGRALTDSHKAQISKSKKEANYMASPEAREKLSAAMKVVWKKRMDGVLPCPRRA